MRSGWIVLTVLVLVAAASARAGEEEEGNSPAESAFRAAWWAETTEGELELAAEGYAKAAEAEGPTAVRARALYRRAIVLERMGRTPEAIRTLERLAERYGDQTELQAKARERLAAWTAVDLRTDFETWYRRYQYSPEFQAHVVELILSLSDASNDAFPKRNAASQELLTIGEASVPALKAHLDTANTSLRGTVVSLLLRLGELPHVRHLEETTTWRNHADAIRFLLRRPDEERQAMRRALGNPEDGFLQYLLGPAAEWPLALEEYPSPTLLYAILAVAPEPAVLRELHALVGHDAFDERSGFEQTLARALFDEGHAAAEQVLAWLRSPSYAVRRYASERIARGEVAPPGIFDDVVAAMRAVDVEDAVQGTLWQALVATLPDEPTDAQLEAAVGAVEHVHPGGRLFFHGPHNLGGPTPPAGLTAQRLTRLYEALVDHAKDPELVEKALLRWDEFAQHDPLVSRRLLAWAFSDLDPAVALRAASLAATRAGAETLDEVLEGMSVARPAVQLEMLRRLAYHERFETLPWTDERIARALEIVRVMPDPPAQDRSAQGVEEAFLKKLLSSRQRTEQFVRLGLERPEVLFSRAVASVPRVHVEAVEGIVRTGLRERWSTWTPAQRLDALRYLSSLWGAMRMDGPLAQFLRAQLLLEDASGDDPEQVLRVKREIAVVLPRLDVAGMRAAYDLETPRGAAQALHHLQHQLEHVGTTEEVYDLLAKARALPEVAARRAVWNHWRRAGEGLRHRVARDMTEDPDPEFRREGLQMLARLQDAGDVPTFRRLLDDADASIRTHAAALLGRLYDDLAVKALVKALDDPNPDVRAAALASLEKIREVEEKKAYWREFAESR